MPIRFVASAVSLCSSICKCFAYHLYIASFINTYILAARALYSTFFLFDLIPSCDPVLMAPQDFSVTNFVILPQLSFTGCTFYN